MLEKVNMYHPDKIADSVAGAVVDCAYTLDDNPKIAVEVLIGHGRATVVAETSVHIPSSTLVEILERIAGLPSDAITFIEVPQDSLLAHNQEKGVRCGDNGVFAAKWNADYEKATEIAAALGERFPSDGKYLFDFENKIATICQSNADVASVKSAAALSDFDQLVVNPLGYWRGGTDTDTGCANRKLGSDQPYCNPNGLHGKDLSKADVSASIYVNDLSRKLGGAFVSAYCSIGDERLLVSIEGKETRNVPFVDMVAFARDYIQSLGGFERFAEHGMRWR